MSQPQVPMVIRERVAGDDRRVAEITRESIELHTTLYEHVRPAPDLDQLVAAFAELGPQPDSYFKVAELDGQVVGFLTAKLRPAPTGGIERCDGPQVFIADVEVTADARGRGIGRCLMEDVTAWAITRGASTITLSVHPHNPAARLYRQLGYQAAWQTFRKDL